MPKWKEGDRVRVVSRPVTEEDRKSNTYFEHMAGLKGTVEYLYDGALVSVKVDPDSLTPISAKVHKGATENMRERFIKSIGEEQRKTLTSEELNFAVNFNILLSADDLESAK